MNSLNNDWHWGCWLNYFFNDSLSYVLRYLDFDWYFNILSMNYLDWIRNLYFHWYWHRYHFLFSHLYCLHRHSLHFILYSDWYHLIWHFLMHLSWSLNNIWLHWWVLLLLILHLRILASNLLGGSLHKSRTSLVSGSISDWSSNSSCNISLSLFQVLSHLWQFLCRL